MKRIMSFILILSLSLQIMLPVSAATTVISNVKAPDYDIWMADAIIQGLNGTGSLYKTFRESQEPVYKTLGAELLNDKPLVSMSTAWSIFLNSEYRNQFVNEQKYIYEIILMDYLKYGASADTTVDEFTGNTFNFTKKLYSTLSDELNDNTLNYIDKELSVDEAEKIWKNAQIADDINTAISVVDDGIKTVKALIEGVSEYLVLKETKDNKISLLKASGVAAGNNVDYKKAVDDVIKALDSTDVYYVQNRSLDYLWNQTLDEAWGVLTDANPVLKNIELGVAGLDVLFDMTNSSSNNLKLVLLYTVDCYMFIGMSNTTQAYLSNKSVENARNFRECFEAYVQFQMFGNEFAKGWIGQYLSGGILKDIFNNVFQRENIKTAKELLERCQKQIDNRKKILELVVDLSGIYKSKYPIVAKQTIPASIRLDKTAASVNVGKSITLKATVVGDSKKVMWKSSNTSVATVNSNGKVTAKKKGTVIITATANGVKVNCKITIKKEGKKQAVRNAYKALLKKYEAKYGTARFYSGYNCYWTGLCFCKLVDLNNDGIEELVLAHQSEKYNVDKVQYHVELWTYDGKNAKKIMSSISWSGNNCPLFGGFSFEKYKGKTYLHTSDSSYRLYYYGAKSNGKLGLVHKLEWKGDIITGQWHYNGKKITKEKYLELYKVLNTSSTIYRFSQSIDRIKIEDQIRKTKKVLGLK